MTEKPATEEYVYYIGKIRFIVTPVYKETGELMRDILLKLIYYNCIGAFDVPDRRKIPEADIIMETRKGVALSYAPEQVAV